MPALKPEWKDTFLAADAVCFDVDSTVCTSEGIDVLASFCGVGQQVKDWTKRAMGGKVTFQEALKARLELIQPSQQQLEACIQRHPLQLTEYIQDLITKLQEKGKHVYLVSGGFVQMIYPIAELLNVSKDRVFANMLLFDETGKFEGFDDSCPTSRSGGKQRVLQLLKETRHYETLVMVGDGVTDLEARPPASLFIGYGGVVEREVVKEKADHFVHSHKELLEVLLD